MRPFSVVPQGRLVKCKQDFYEALAVGSQGVITWADKVVFVKAVEWLWKRPLWLKAIDCVCLMFVRVPARVIASRCRQRSSHITKATQLPCVRIWCTTKKANGTRAESLAATSKISWPWDQLRSLTQMRLNSVQCVYMYIYIYIYIYIYMCVYIYVNT
jgi:hypothetical protein